jgi:tRNA pseudouridine38-40 synthase
MSDGIQRWKCVVAYDGTSYRGWQSQTGKDAIQDVLEARLATMFGRVVRVHGSGRTDAGVHALGQVFHFDALWSHGSDRLLSALRVGLPPSLQVRSAEPVGPGFHARFSAIGKRYRYHLHVGGFADPFHHAYRWSLPRPLDLDALRAGASVLVGRHDFRAFSAFNGEEKNDTVRTLRVLRVDGEAPELSVVAEADGFLYKMVRSLVGALVFVGSGRLTPDDLTQILSKRERTHRIETAPPQGLFLEEVFYPPEPPAG